MKKKLSIVSRIVLGAVAFSLMFGMATYAQVPYNIGVSQDSGADVKTGNNMPIVSAETAVLMDANSGQILYGKDVHKQMYPASITKILTGILAVEKGNPDDVVTVSPYAQSIESGGVANIGLKKGEQLTQNQLLYGMFLASANEAATVLAEHIGGNVQNFAKMMNDTAKQLGAQNSNFVNPNGLPNDAHVTTAYDMAMITKKAVSMPGVMKYFGAKAYTIPATNKTSKPRVLSTLQKMMKKNSGYYNESVIAGKTGWSTKSGHTMVTVAKKGNATLICVVMKSSNSNTTYTDTANLLEYGFDNFSFSEMQPAVTNIVKNTGNKLGLNSIMADKKARAGVILTVALVSCCLLAAAGMIVYRVKLRNLAE